MLTVMIVDDMEVMRRQIKRLPLWGEITGFNIIDEAEDGQEALYKLQRQPVDLLITDIKMPRIDGIELLREVYKNHLAACVVFLSEHSEFSFAKEAIQYDIFDYLIKPVEAEELKILLQKVRNYIEENRRKQIHLRKLEDKIIEKMDIYYPNSHLRSIIKYISEGNKEAIKFIEVMVEHTAAALDYDMTKIGIVLQKVYDEIWVGVNKNHMWIEELVDITAFIDISLVHLNNIDSMKKKILEMQGFLMAVINKFIIDIDKRPLIKEICIYIIKNVENDISITKIGEALFFTKNYISDTFRQETNMTVGEYITMVKIERAKKLIIEGLLRNYEIAQKLGYKNVEYFEKLFKKNTGLTPIGFRNVVDS